jgi:hypothetical protein
MDPPDASFPTPESSFLRLHEWITREFLGWQRFAWSMEQALGATREDANDGCLIAAVEIQERLILESNKREILFASVDEVQAFADSPIIWSAKKETFVPLKPTSRIAGRIKDVVRKRSDYDRLIHECDRDDNTPESIAPVPDDDLSPEQKETLCNQARETLLKEIAALPSTQRQYLQFRLDGLSHREIAQKLYILEDTARMNSHRAEKRLTSTSRLIFKALIRP